MDVDAKSHEIANRILLTALMADPEYKTQATGILDRNSWELDADFLGFVGTYYHLAQIIPTDRIVYDMGCCFGLQAWFFRNHQKYIGVDSLTEPKNQLQTPNSEYHHTDMAAYLKATEIEAPHFAICNYVPPWGQDNEKLVKDFFRHVYVFYPINGDPFVLLKGIS